MTLVRIAPQAGAVGASGPAGASGGVSGIWLFDADSIVTTTAPASGYMRANNASPAAVTELRFSENDSTGAVMGYAINFSLRVGSIITLRWGTTAYTYRVSGVSTATAFNVLRYGVQMAGNGQSAFPATGTLVSVGFDLDSIVNTSPQGGMWSYSSDTSVTSFTTGAFKFNTAAHNSITQMGISNTASDGGPRTVMLASLTPGMTVTLTDPVSGAAYFWVISQITTYGSGIVITFTGVPEYNASMVLSGNSLRYALSFGPVQKLGQNGNGGLWIYDSTSTTVTTPATYYMRLNSTAYSTVTGIGFAVTDRSINQTNGMDMSTLLAAVTPGTIISMRSGPRWAMYRVTANAGLASSAYSYTVTYIASSGTLTTSTDAYYTTFQIGAVPPGGASGAVLTKTTSADGDYAWAAAGGGGGLGVSTLAVIKPADTARTSTVTLAVDPHLVLTLAPGTWFLDGNLLVNTAENATATPGIAANFQYSGGSVGFPAPWNISSSLNSPGSWKMNDGNKFTSAGNTGVGPWPMSAMIVVTATTTVGVYWSQNNTSATATTVKAGSYLRAIRTI